MSDKWVKNYGEGREEIKKKRKYNSKIKDIETPITDRMGNLLPISLEAVKQLLKLHENLNQIKEDSPTC